MGLIEASETEAIADGWLELVHEIETLQTWMLIGADYIEKHHVYIDEIQSIVNGIDKVIVGGIMAQFSDQYGELPY